jgi:predicted nucleic acid-binding protein
VSLYLLDSDIIIWYLRGREETHQFMQDIQRVSVPSCSSLSITEVVLGMKKKEEKVTREFLNSLEVIPVGRQEGWLAGELIRKYQTQGTTLDFIDATIAASCILHNLILVTYNSKHFPMPELTIYPFES